MLNFSLINLSSIVATVIFASVIAFFFVAPRLEGVQQVAEPQAVHHEVAQAVEPLAAVPLREEEEEEEVEEEEEEEDGGAQLPPLQTLSDLSRGVAFSDDDSEVGDLVNAWLVMAGLRPGCIFDLIIGQVVAKFVVKATGGRVRELCRSRHSGLVDTSQVQARDVKRATRGCVKGLMEKTAAIAHVLGYPILEARFTESMRQSSFVARINVFVEKDDNMGGAVSSSSEIMTACYGKAASRSTALRNFKGQAARFSAALVGQRCGSYVIKDFRAMLTNK